MKYKKINNVNVEVSFSSVITRKWHKDHILTRNPGCWLPTRNSCSCLGPCPSWKLGDCSPVIENAFFNTLKQSETQDKEENPLRANISLLKIQCCVCLYHVRSYPSWSLITASSNLWAGRVIGSSAKHMLTLPDTHLQVLYWKAYISVIGIVCTSFQTSTDPCRCSDRYVGGFFNIYNIYFFS